MGWRNTIECYWFTEDELDVDHFPLVSTLQSVGFSTTEDGTDDHFEFYRPVADDIASDASVETMEAHLRENAGELKLWADGLEFEFDFQEPRDDWSMFSPVVATHDIGPSSTKGLFDTDEHGWDRVVSRSDAVFEMFRSVAEVTDPWYAVCSFCRLTPKELPDGRPPESGLSTLPWGAVFGEEWTAEFGDRDRMLETPAYEVEELPTGSVLVRAHDIPDWAGQTEDLDRGSWMSTEEYLFDRRSKREMRAERRRLESTYTDPLSELAPGERAVDVVVCPEHAPCSTRDVDYARVTDAVSLGDGDACRVLWVYRDGDDDCLREVDTDSFVRRFVDEDGRPIGDPPDDVPPRNELLSLKVQDEWNGGTFSTDRLESVDEDHVESTTAYVMGLWRYHGPDSIWQGEGRLGDATETLTWWGE